MASIACAPPASPEPGRPATAASLPSLPNLPPVRARPSPHRGGSAATCAARAASRRAADDPDNIFAKIIDGKVPCYKLFETEHALAFLDAFPMTRGHALLIPKARLRTAPAHRARAPRRRRHRAAG